MEKRVLVIKKHESMDPDQVTDDGSELSYEGDGDSLP